MKCLKLRVSWRERKIGRRTELAIDTIVLLTHGVIAGDHSGSVSTHLLCMRGENICRDGEETERRCGDTQGCSHGPDNGPFVRHCVRGTLIVSLRPDDLRGYDSPPPFPPRSSAPLIFPPSSFLFRPIPFAPFFPPRPIPLAFSNASSRTWGRRRWTVQFIDGKIVPWNQRRRTAFLSWRGNVLFRRWLPWAPTRSFVQWLYACVLSESF